MTLGANSTFFLSHLEVNTHVSLNYWGASLTFSQIFIIRWQPTWHQPFLMQYKSNRVHEYLIIWSETNILILYIKKKHHILFFFYQYLLKKTKELDNTRFRTSCFSSGCVPHKEWFAREISRRESEKKLKSEVWRKRSCICSYHVMQKWSQRSLDSDTQVYDVLHLHKL